jgi:chemotaxis protein methyltransferase CheR
MVTFKRRNLQDDLNSLGFFDLVLCRNVAIYFEEHFKCDLFNRLAQIIYQNGRLMLGGTDSLLSHQDIFQPEQVGGSFFYRKKI